MNVQERDALMRMLQSLGQVRLTEKDLVAESLILEAASRQPDALYLLAQRVMVLQAALAAAQARVGELGAAQATGAAGPAASVSEGAWRRGLVAQGAAVAVGAAVGVMAGAAGAAVLGDALADGASDLFDGLAPSDWL